MMDPFFMRRAKNHSELDENDLIDITTISCSLTETAPLFT